jgi:cytochrome P450
MSTLSKSPDLQPSPPIGKTFPGPRGHWLRGCLHQMQDDPLGLYSQARAEYGDYVRIRIVPHIYAYVLTHPDAVEHVLHKGHKNYRKPDIFYKSVGLLVGNGLFTNEGEPWLRQRKLASPAFHSNFIAMLSTGMVESAEAFAAEMQAGEGKPIDMLEGMMKLGLCIASTTLFSADISGDTDSIGKAFRATFKHVSNRLNSMQLIPNWLPTKANRSFAAAKKFLDGKVMELIAARRKSATKPRDLLTMLIDAHDEMGKGMMDRQLMDEVLTLLTAAHETIGAALAWTWYLLALHPEIQTEVYDEVHGRLGGRSPGFDDLPNLPLTTAVFKESMRLYPPGWGELREAIEPDHICGYDVPAKAMIILCQWVTHRHPDFWEEPEKFKPERFLPGNAEKHHRFAYFPFGGGPRICIGMQFAMVEGPLVIATILQRFRVELVADQQIVPDATFTLRPRYGLKVILHPRKAGGSQTK